QHHTPAPVARVPSESGRWKTFPCARRNSSSSTDPATIKRASSIQVIRFTAHDDRPKTGSRHQGVNRLMTIPSAARPARRCSASSIRAYARTGRLPSLNRDVLDRLGASALALEVVDVVVEQRPHRKQSIALEVV